jgi:hypothetical protein
MGCHCAPPCHLCNIQNNYSTSVMLPVITCYIVVQCNHCPRSYIPHLILASSHLEVLVASVYNRTTCKNFEVFSFYDFSISIHILFFSYVVSHVM